VHGPGDSLDAAVAVDEAAVLGDPAALGAPVALVAGPQPAPMKAHAAMMSHFTQA